MKYLLLSFLLVGSNSFAFEYVLQENDKDCVDVSADWKGAKCQNKPGHAGICICTYLEKAPGNVLGGTGGKTKVAGKAAALKAELRK